MTECLLYQTVEDRDNPDNIEAEGPFKCTRKDAWLGEGYYFWEAEVQFAHKWGINAGYKEYVVCESAYDYDNPCFFDIVGNPSHLRTMREITEELRRVMPKNCIITIPMVIKSLKIVLNDEFSFKAIRSRSEWKPWEYIMPYNEKRPRGELCNLNPEIQLCVIDKEILIKEYRIVYPEKYLT